MSKNKFNKSWMRNHLGDPYVKLAQKEGYRARAVYKLSEIDEDTGLIKPGQIIVDLGCAPGSWSQYITRKLGAQGSNQVNGVVVGLDILPMEPVPGVHFLQGDFREESVLNELETLLKGRKVDLVLSDMAPNLSGIASTDAARVEYLMELALDFAQVHLKPSGSLLVKCFNGSSYNEILKRFRETFISVTPKKPKASRDYSSEIFLLGRQLRHGEE
ncbi:RlmE family RNA methyltransferase [Oxalobacter aliiformigenes]|uniref:Ribosomal RNA large subunit methyltransferase E n=1 Tax=Oxalobacter aliiformigenes TaxID=2946593 RepID=A0A9E9NTS2_9BURK|nr:RlmE family RNA methyltransferase [Oxalobacter aliiformigenes]WAV90857.1 RlmE family RNA methyltransferase [Oxalobacter aliiformigenes]WAV92922.1 RlmE family RNA methyltransferase [Oxalobacter aliiformigenes]WAV95575.1 RlmE family RNA methyltransferase [Oxalobacter aliiformigenes]WAV96631.1 RlmE family RNA methyltransferase [Oxalobacter aliiformigenes]